MILSKYIKVCLTSNDLIQAMYLEHDEDKTLWYEYFTNMSILFRQNYNINNLNKDTMERFSRILYIYLSTYIKIIEDSIYNRNYHPTEYLNSLSLFGLPLFSLKQKFGCPIMLL